MKPSEEIQAALDGAVLPSEITPASLSAMRFKIYQISCDVLSKKSREEQRKLIESHPEAIQVLLRSECRRIYDHRMQEMQRAPSKPNKPEREDMR